MKTEETTEQEPSALEAVVEEAPAAAKEAPAPVEETSTPVEEPSAPLEEAEATPSITADPCCSNVSFKEDAGRRHKWRGNALGAHLRSADLFCEDDGHGAPITSFIRARKDYTTGTATPSRLVLTSRGLQIRDTVVISFLFLEKTRRTNETASQYCTDVLSTPVLSAVTGSDYNVCDGGV
ncbi:hypothetical protein BD413DRAFT_479916 [Trametes elegans]|nr:hypothetical protein BD413DRAFT_479916 [Trametes elegans]